MRRLGRLFAFFLVTGLSALVVHQLIGAGLRSIRTSGLGAFNRAMAGEVNAEILISGSSRALVHYDPAILRGATGRSTYNLGLNASHLDVQLGVLRAYLAKNRKPQLLVQNLDLHSLKLSTNIYNAAQFVPYLSEPHIYAALRKIEPDLWKSRLLPLYGYVAADMRYTWILGVLALFGVQPPEDHFDGYNPRDLSWTGDFDQFRQAHPDGVEIEIQPEARALLVELLALCRAEGIRVCLVYSPEYHEMVALTRNRPALFAEFSRIAEEGGAEFLDFSAWPPSTNRALFYNSQHLNRAGATAFTADLASRLTEMPWMRQASVTLRGRHKVDPYVP